MCLSSPQVIAESMEMRKRMEALSPRLLSILGDMRSIDAATDLLIPVDSADLLLLEHMLLESVAQHRRHYRSEERLWKKKQKKKKKQQQRETC